MQALFVLLLYMTINLLLTAGIPLTKLMELLRLKQHGSGYTESALGFLYMINGGITIVALLLY